MFHHRQGIAGDKVGKIDTDIAQVKTNRALVFHTQPADPSQPQKMVLPSAEERRLHLFYLSLISCCTLSKAPLIVFNTLISILGVIF